MYDFDPSGSTALIVLLTLVLFLVPTIFYFISLQKALEAVSAEHRMMPPGQVWLSLIPILILCGCFLW
ncbi:MAG: hypothetical protein JNM14_16240 [Ferruginibacter sp.]|nr:hypothetical protein [Ferruginibacter sp.]